MTKYEIQHPDITVWAWYRAGKIAKLALRKGDLRGDAWAKVALWVPGEEGLINSFADRWPKIKYRQVTGTTERLYKYLVADWFVFYHNLNGLEYKFSGVDGKAMKQIEKYLVGNFGEDARAQWQAILGSWHRLPEFYRKKADVVFVNAKLNEILTQLKHNEQFKTDTDSEDLRGKL